MSDYIGLQFYETQRQKNCEVAKAIDVLRQIACLVVNSIKVNNFAYLFYCMTVGRASD